MSTSDAEPPDGGGSTQAATTLPPPVTTAPEFVMVPVPEEFVEEVAQLVMQASFREMLVRWDDAAVHRLRAALDDRSWTMVELLARAGDPLGEEDLTRELGVTHEELGTLRDRVTAGCATIERLDLVLESEHEGRPQWTIRKMALDALLTLLDEDEPTA